MRKEPDRSKRNLVALTGGISVALYVVAVILGGILDPNYSQIRNAISELTASRAPNAALLAPFFIAYNFALLGLAVALLQGSTSGMLFRVAASLFAVGALSGVGQVTLFRMDSIGAPATAQGAVHIALAGVSSVVTLAGTVVYGFAFRHVAGWRRLSTVSFVAAAGILVTAPGAALSIGTPLMGLFERLTIGCFMVWVVMVSAYALEVPTAMRLTDKAA